MLLLLLLAFGKYQAKDSLLLCFLLNVVCRIRLRGCALRDPRYFQKAQQERFFTGQHHSYNGCTLISIELRNRDSVGVTEPWLWPDAFSAVTCADLGALQRKSTAGHIAVHYLEAAARKLGHP